MSSLHETADAMEDEGSESKFYKDAAEYWSRVPPTMQGMLGGFEFISDADIEGSKRFLEEFFQRSEPPGRKMALDCGAGIGRVTKHLLSEYFDSVDLVEQNGEFLNMAKESINPAKLGTAYTVGLQNFVPEKKYDIIWSQWVLGHLEDEDLIKFLGLCRNSLNANGLLVVKENVTSSNTLEKDYEDSSVTRSLKHMLTIFKKAKLKIIKEYKHNDFPKGIYPVYMFALRPKNVHLKNLQSQEIK